MARTKKENPWKEKLASEISWQAVADEIEKWGLPGYDATEVLGLVTEAALKFVPEDFSDGHRVIVVEGEKVVGLFKGVRDLVVIQDDVEKVVRVVDWKTTGSVDAKWVEVHRKGWQRLWYGALEWGERPEGYRVEVEFRGIERGGGRTRVLKVEFGEEQSNEAMSVLELAAMLRFADLEVGTVSLRFGGYTCFGFGEPCPYLGERCEGDSGITPEERSALALAPISPSSAERIRTCPRKNTLYQLDRLRGGGDNNLGGEKAIFGNAFHSGIAEVYRQLGGGE